MSSVGERSRGKLGSMRVAILVALISLLAGCGSDDSSSSPTSKQGQACSTSSECGAGACYFGVCAMACGSASDCDPGSVCSEVAGVPGGVEVLSGACPEPPAAGGGKLCLPEQARLSRALGTVQNGQAVVLDFAAGAASFALVGQTQGDEPVGFARLRGPDGHDLFVATADPAQMLKNEVWFYPEAFVATLQVPTTPDHPLGHGAYCATLESGGPLELTALTKRDSGGDVSAGRLDVDVYLTGLSEAGCGLGGVTAAAAPSHPVLTSAVKTVTEIFAGAALTLGDVSYHERPSIPALEQLTTNDPATFDPVFALATDSAGYSVDVFIVPTMADGAGFAGHMPGPPGLHAVPRSGVVVSAETACSQTLGVVIAHEVSHLLGLFLNYQPDPGFEDPIQDTGTGQDDLMHITPTTQSTKLSAGQGFVLRRHSNVGW